ncbi:uncharacterized protein PAC_17734 [Phialocephala subalpina]|uniref:Protein kinase domain-containing protein n=1 Tax=Phialocephala subalpina TaxID=576137 RepID=A0A1L7XS57_9HELO|nr:uncharacterized protein PAC_17734 [Phialocephala subalpina]
MALLSDSLALNNLDDRIYRLGQRNDHNHKYIPEGTLEGVLDEPCIRELLKRQCFGISLSDHENVANRVINGGRKILAILIHIRATGCLRAFLSRSDNNNSIDSRLPLNIRTIKEFLPDPLKAERFDTHQWKFLAAVLREDDFLREYNTNMIFPYLKDNKASTQGASSDLYELQIDTRHWEPLDSSLKRSLYAKLVRKELKDDSKARSEEQMYRWLNSAANESTIKLYHSYSVNGTLNLLFPQYEMDLYKFLDREKPRSLFSSNQAYYTAIHKLAIALQEFHNFSHKGFGVERIGCHYDLKPNNILVDCEQFILADFGDAAFRNPIEGSKQLSPNPGGQYIAPEREDIENEFKKGESSRPSDVWSFGCILLEIAVYMRFGVQALRDFRKARTHKFIYGTCQRFYSSGRLLDKVEEELGRLDSRSEVDAMNSSSLLVELLRRILVIDPKDRPEMRDVVKSLEEILEKSKLEEAIPHTPIMAQTPVPKPPVIDTQAHASVRVEGNSDSLDSVTDIGVRNGGSEEVPLQSVEALPVSFLDMRRKQTQALGRLVSAGNGLGLRSAKISGRVKSLWKRSKKNYCINKWASMVSSSVIVIYVHVGDRARELAEITSIVAACVVKDARRQELGYHVLYHFFQETNTQSQDRALQLASSLLIQMMLLDEVAVQRCELTHILESKDVSKVMASFIKAYKSLPGSQRVIIVLDRLVGLGTNKDYPFERLAEVICPLVELAHQYGDQVESSCAPLKLFLSLSFSPRFKGLLKQNWGIQRDEVVFNRTDAINDDTQGFEKVFWENQHLLWFAG